MQPLYTHIRIATGRRIFGHGLPCCISRGAGEHERIAFVVNVFDMLPPHEMQLLSLHRINQTAAVVAVMLARGG